MELRILSKQGTKLFTSFGKYNTFRTSNRQTSERKHQENYPWRVGRTVHASARAGRRGI